MVDVTKGIKIGILWRKALASRQTERRWRRGDGMRARGRAGATLAWSVCVCVFGGGAQLEGATGSCGATEPLEWESRWRGPRGEER